MFKKDDDYQGNGETIIARGVKLEGDFKSEGNVVVEGEVSGTLTAGNDLRVNEGAVINADVKTENAVVAGEINGNVKVIEKLELLATAKINGDINTKVLSITPGAIVNGKISMGEERVAEPAEKNIKRETKKTSKTIDPEEIEL